MMLVAGSRRGLFNRTPLEWLFSLPVFLLLVLTLVISTGEMLHGRMLKLGESVFGDPSQQVQYFMLRADPVRPTCDRNSDIEAQVRPSGTPADKAAAGDAVDALFGDRPQTAEEQRSALLGAREECRLKHDFYERAAGHITPMVRVFRAVETGFFALFEVGTHNRPLILLLMVSIAAIVTTLANHHISIRPARTVLDQRVSNGAIAIASGMLLFSCVRYYQITAATGLVVEHPLLHVLWCALFSAMLVISGYRIWRPVPAQAGGSWGMALLSVPLFATMAMICGLYFFSKGHPSGLAIYINQLMELPTIFLNLALFIFAGMLLKQTDIVDRFLNLLRPWRLSPELLTYIILLAAAVPTAYTGASGIFVIAAGGIIYREVLHAGGTRQFALAATAMSGSLGVVLRPCLLVVLIAMLNKQVTTSTLFHWGFFVFLLTSTLFFLASQMRRTQRAQVEVPMVAIRAMLKESIHILPYVAMAIGLVVFYAEALDTSLNEISAPTIMPVLMLLLLVIDKWLAHRRGGVPLPAVSVSPTPHQTSSHSTAGIRFEPAIRMATNETIGHIGALITLMALSLAVGGFVERSEIMSHAPQTFSNVWLAMLFLVVTKVLLGMVMDPFGAVILVSSTLAPIAYNSGIDPVHFWMMVLVAFELGYLMPPVALNQLLTRQVVGETEIDKADAEVRNKGFYGRYERWILPSLVMTVGLLIVAFLPLAIQQFEWLAPVRELLLPGA